MTFRNKYLFIVVSILSLAALLSQFAKSLRGEDGYSIDMPRKLSDQAETLTVKFIPRSCLCPEWTDVRDTNRFFYIEPRSFDLPDAYSLAARQDSSHLFRLEGAYYNSNGLPEGFTGDREEAVQGPVFQYRAVETIKTDGDSL